MEKIDLNKIRGKWESMEVGSGLLSGGDDTVESIRTVARKLNELIEELTITGILP